MYGGTAPNQYRILTPLLAEGLHRLAGGPAADRHPGVYAGIVFLASLALFPLFYAFCRAWLRPVEALLATAILCVLLPLTYHPNLIQPTDPLNPLVVVAGLLALSRGRGAHLLWLLP